MTLRLLLILGALTAFGPLAIDLYLPAFPALAQAFGTDVEHVQLSLATYFVGLALGQLAYGPVIDRFGRRGPLLFGIVLFCIASLGCALATSLEQLMVARFVQAVGGCVGMVASRTVVRDLCDPPTTAKVFSQLMLVMGLAPILAPAIGALLLEQAGWMSIFVLLSLFSAVCGVAVYRWLPETYPAGLARVPLGRALPQYLRLLRDRTFMGHTFAGGFAMAGMFAYIAGSPFVFIDLYGVAPSHYGWLFGANAAGFILMAQVNARLIRLHGPQYWLLRWSALHGLAGLVLLGVALAHPAALVWLLPPLFGSIATLGGMVPNATACALAGQGENAGSASALLGSVQFGIAALASAAVGALHDGSAVPMAGVMAASAVVSLLCTLATGRGRPG